MQFPRSTFLYSILFMLLGAVLVACGSAPRTGEAVGSVSATVTTPLRTDGPVVEQPTLVATPAEVPTTTLAAEQPTSTQAAEEPTEAAAAESTPTPEVTLEGAVRTVRDLLSTFGKGDINQFLTTRLQEELASTRTTDEALGLHEAPLKGFEVGEPRDEPSEVLLVPATLRYEGFVEERQYELVVEEGQWRVANSSRINATGDAGVCQPASTETKGSVNIVPPFCVVWADTFDDEQGFRITLQYLGTNGDSFTYEVGPHVTEFVVPEEDRPRTDESPELCAQRGSFSVQVMALRASGEEIVGGMAMDSECGMVIPTPEATERAGASAERVVYIRFDYARQGAEVRSVGIDGSDDRVLFSCEEPCDITGIAVSPVRDEIAFTSHGQGETQSLVIARADGTELRRLRGNTFITAQAWSPDGERLAYVQSRATGDTSPVEESAVFVIDREGVTTQLTKWTYFTGAPLWLDGDHLLFSRATAGTPPTAWKTYQVDTWGTMQEELVADGELADASPDRSHLLVMVETTPDDAAQRVLTLVPLNGGEPQPIADNVDRFAVAWAPGGESFVFFDPSTRAITRVQESDGSRTELRALEGTSSIPFARFAWGPDGNDLYYTQTGGEQTEIHRLQVETGDDQVIASYEGDPKPLAVVR